MVKCTKMKNGFVVELDGDPENMIMEVAYAAATYHVKEMKKLENMNMDDPESIRSAIVASADLFGLVMQSCMEKVLGVDVGLGLGNQIASLLGEKGGEVQ